jgi:hypothetical protein
MPYRRLPNSMPAVLRTLTTARDAWKETTDPSSRLISATHWAQLDDTATPPSFLTRLLKEASDVDLALAAQAPLTTALAKGAARLTLFVSHFHQVYDFGVARGTFAAGGRAYYGRPINATALPDLSSYENVLTAAEKIVSGEAARATAEAASYVPMALPSAAEITPILAEVRRLRTDSRKAQAHTDQQEGELSALYTEAQRLAVSVCNTIEYHLSERLDLDDAGRRHIARRWGVVYIYEPHEQPDPEDANAGNTTLSGPIVPIKSEQPST